MIGRETEQKLLTLAVVAKEHILLVGPPGTGKSRLVEGFAGAAGFSYFRWLLTKFSTPDEVFGPVSLAGLKTGSFERILTGRVATAQIAFLDEIFKASSSILNSLLTLMEERVVHNPAPYQTPLLTLVGASNEVPDGDQADALSALWDRFLLRTWVDPIPEGDWNALLEPGAGDPPTVDTKRIKDAQGMLDHVTIGPDERAALIDMRLKFAHDLGLHVSDRRFVKAAKLLRAAAAYRGDNKVQAEDFEYLTWVFVQDLQEVGKIHQAVLSFTDPEAAEVEALQDSAFAMVRAFDEERKDMDFAAVSTRAAEVNAELRQIANRLRQIKTTKAADVLASVVERQKMLAKILLGEEYTD